MMSILVLFVWFIVMASWIRPLLVRVGSTELVEAFMKQRTAKKVAVSCGSRVIWR